MQLRIWHKMIVGIAIPSLIAAFGSMLSFNYIRSIENRQEYVQIADDLKENVLEVSQNEEIFFHYKNEKYFNRFRNSVTVLLNLIKNISIETGKGLGQDDFSLLRENIQNYPELINKLYANFQREARDTEEVRTAGRLLEEISKEGIYPEELDISFILNLRLLEKNYMLFRSGNSLAELSGELEKLNNLTFVCNECKDYTDRVHKLISVYKEGDLLIQRIQFLGDRLKEITGRIVVREREMISSFLAKTRHLLLLALVMICILGPFFVQKTATIIAAPIKRLAELTKKIADGDTSLRAPIKEHDETYLLATSFNTMLDRLQSTHRSLEKSMKLLQEKQAQLVDSEKRASLGLLVSGVAHELNNPLNNISLTAEAINDDIENITTEELKECIQDILNQRRRAQHIVENLLDFARARRDTHMGKQNITHIVQDSFSLISNELKINNINLVRSIPHRPVYIKGNRSKLEQILVSIYTNAIQAMEAGGTLSLSLEPVAEKNCVLIKISDNGPGISRSNMKNIFEPFFTTKPAGEGTGLGLSVCYSLVKEHNGEIEVESNKGKGTTFIITLPMYVPRTADIKLL